jgi:tetratricopeptide (TPR) repeat protein
VVIDNAATHEQAISLLPTEPPHAAIVTSRDTLGLLHARLLDLDILTTENAADMLDSALRVARPGDTRATDHPDDAARIAELCKGLPLALRIISALLSENLRRPLSEMAADLNDERTRLDELSYGDTTARAAFDLSYRRLDQAHARLFRLLTIIPEPDISTLTTAALADLDERAARRGLEALARAHFIGPGGSYGRWRMHDLLRLYAQQLSDAHAGVDGREQAQDRLLSYYQENLGPALRQVRRSAETTTAHQEMATIFRETGEGHTLTELGLALVDVRRFREAITACQRTAAIFRETGDRRNEGMALNNTGVALQQVGRFAEAITAWQETAAIFRETGDRYLQGMAVDNLGLVLQQVERFAEAVTAHQEAAAIFRETGDRDLQGMALGNLAMALQQVERFTEAVTAWQETAAIFRDTGNQGLEGMALTNLESVRAALQS